MRTIAFRCAPAFILIIASVSALCIAATNLHFGQPGQEKTASSTQQSKVAEGEYAISEPENGGAVGPFGEEVYDFHETWTLWRLADSSYKVEGERRFESPKESAHADRFVVELSRDLTINRVTEFARLRWKRDSGPLTCEFRRSALHCSSNAKNPGQSLVLDIPMQEPFGLLWPISAFSLSGLTREAERDPHQETQVQLVSIQQPSAEIPVNPMILGGELRYLGEETISVVGQPRRAFKFSIKPPVSPEFIVWTSPRGLLLEVAIRHEGKDWPEEAMKLIHFQEAAGFE